jgi:ADP-ribose pyrophosphatase YjhB (NUDIX family)
MMRAPHPETGKPHYLLQKRKDGSWGLPGGTCHVGEHPLVTAIREATEEVGDLPPVQPSAYLAHQDEDRTAHIFVCDMPWFTPKLNGSTPEETHGTGWFRKKEIPNLDLHPKFKKQWDRIDWSNINKNTRQIVTENGEQLTVTDSGGPLVPAGARWPYPHRSDGSEDPHYGTAYVPEPPNDLSSGTHTRVYEGDDTDEYPRARGRNRGPKRQAPPGTPTEENDSNGDAGSGVSSPGSSTGVPPSGGKAAPRPVVGSVPAVTPKPANPTSVPPQTFDPAETVESWSDEDESNTYVPLPPAGKKSVQADADLADPKKPGGPSDYSDPNPVNAEHVMNMMRANFPEDAIQWVMRAKWIGPINVPWNRIDSDGIETWAATHQLDQVNRFARDIKAGSAHVNPSVCIQDDDTPKAIIIDGHHRALAHKKLGQPVLAYVGQIDPKDRKAAEETHSKQVHSGADPRNK